MLKLEKIGSLWQVSGFFNETQMFVVHHIFSEVERYRCWHRNNKWPPYHQFPGCFQEFLFGAPAWTAGHGQKSGVAIVRFSSICETKVITAVDWLCRYLKMPLC